MIADLTRIKDCKEWSEGMEGGVYAQDKLNIRANAPSQLLHQSSVQKGSIFGKRRYLLLLLN